MAYEKVYEQIFQSAVRRYYFNSEAVKGEGRYPGGAALIAKSDYVYQFSGDTLDLSPQEEMSALEAEIAFEMYYRNMIKNIKSANEKDNTRASAIVLDENGNVFKSFDAVINAFADGKSISFCGANDGQIATLSANSDAIEEERILLDKRGGSNGKPSYRSVMSRGAEKFPVTESPVFSIKEKAPKGYDTNTPYSKPTGGGLWNSIVKLFTGHSSERWANYDYQQKEINAREAANTLKLQRNINNNFNSELSEDKKSFIESKAKERYNDAHKDEIDVFKEKTKYVAPHKEIINEEPKKPEPVSGVKNEKKPVNQVKNSDLDNTVPQEKNKAEKKVQAKNVIKQVPMEDDEEEYEEMNNSLREKAYNETYKKIDLMTKNGGTHYFKLRTEYSLLHTLSTEKYPLNKLKSTYQDISKKPEIYMARLYLFNRMQRAKEKMGNTGKGSGDARDEYNWLSAKMNTKLERGKENELVEAVAAKMRNSSAYESIKNYCAIDRPSQKDNKEFHKFFTELFFPADKKLPLQFCDMLDGADRSRKKLKSDEDWLSVYKNSLENSEIDKQVDKQKENSSVISQ